MIERASISDSGFAHRRGSADGAIRLGGRHEDARSAADLDATSTSSAIRPRAATVATPRAAGRRSRSGGSRSAGLETAAIDQFADLVGDLLIEPARLDRLELEGHEGVIIRRGPRRPAATDPLRTNPNPW
jgi:hypothetical protein